MADEISSRRTEVALDIWNRALDRIGETAQIENENEKRVAAAVCRRHYKDIVEEALDARPWPFATRQCRPSHLVGARVGWGHAYVLPADFLSARNIISGDLRYSLTPGEDRIPYELQDMADDSGLLLCTDYLFEGEDALEYTTRHSNPAAWPRLFVSAVAFRLAFELALAIPKDTRKAESMYQAYLAELAKAYARCRNQQVPDQPLEAENIRARR